MSIIRTPFPLPPSPPFGLGYLIKKVLDATSDFDDAERINEDAKEVYDSAMQSLERRREETQKSLNPHPLSFASSLNAGGHVLGEAPASSRQRSAPTDGGLDPCRFRFSS